jgi:hypothetical protein
MIFPLIGEHLASRFLVYCRRWGILYSSKSVKNCERKYVSEQSTMGSELRKVSEEVVEVVIGKFVLLVVYQYENPPRIKNG